MVQKLRLSVVALLLLAVPLAICLSPAHVEAVNVFQDSCSGGGRISSTDVCSAIKPGTPGANPIVTILKVTIEVISIIVGVTSVIMIIIAGMSMITSNGDSQSVAKARSGVIYALVGLVIVALAQSIVLFVLNKL